MTKQITKGLRMILVLLLAGMIEADHLTSTTTAQRNEELHEPPDLNQIMKNYQELEEARARFYPGEMSYQDIEMEKRAPAFGFQGMRGKKANGYNLDGGSYPDYQDYYNDLKRAPMMGFQGMRGKKAFEDGVYDELDKRAPIMGFQGMRGKKSLEEVLQDEIEKRKIMGFHGMRGKKYYDDDDSLDAEWSKRAPNGFFGMRGRKSSGFINNDLDEYDKRALMRFHGMRGKKNSQYDYQEPEVDYGYLAKRPMMMGFHGMRGKRSTNYFDVSGSYDNRAPSYRYYGPRGKKVPPGWALRGKFVGVRGKKWTTTVGAQPPPRSLLRTHPRYYLFDDRTFY